MTVKEYLIQNGVGGEYSGYHYIIEGVQIIKNTPNKSKIKMMVLYRQIAEKHETTASRVERAIRHAISKLKYNKHNNNGHFLFYWAEVENAKD